MWNLCGISIAALLVKSFFNRPACGTRRHTPPLLSLEFVVVVVRTEQTSAGRGADLFSSIAVLATAAWNTSVARDSRSIIHVEYPNIVYLVYDGQPFRDGSTEIIYFFFSESRLEETRLRNWAPGRQAISWVPFLEMPVRWGTQ